MKYQNQIAIKGLAEKMGTFNERQFSEKLGISRTSLRSVMSRNKNISLNSITKIAAYFTREVHLLAINPDTNSDMSTIAVSYKVQDQGFDSWKIHFLNFVDEFRSTLDPQLLSLAPSKKLDMRLKALLASIVISLCQECEIDAPSWASKMYYLEKPWFVSGMQSLKAMAILESPLAFRRNNIFVHNNFLERL